MVVVSSRSLKVLLSEIVLLAVPQPAHQQRQANETVQLDHDDREYRVPRDSRILAASDRDRHDHDDFHASHGNGQEQRAVGLAQHDR